MNEAEAGPSHLGKPVRIRDIDGSYPRGEALAGN